MSDNRSAAKQENFKVTHGFFSGKTVGKSLKEVAVDLIKTESEDLVSRWYHGKAGADLFTWADRRNNIIKQQLNFNGQVVEWNCLEGLKTGLVVELDMESEKKSNEEVEMKPSETIKFDMSPQNNSIVVALEILQYTEIDLGLRDQLIGNFKDPKNIENMSPEAFLGRFGSTLKNFQSKEDPGFWGHLRTRFKAIFNK